jgi:hypothetical protein
MSARIEGIEVRERGRRGTADLAVQTADSVAADVAVSGCAGIYFEVRALATRPRPRVEDAETTRFDEALKLRDSTSTQTEMGYETIGFGEKR